MVGKIFLREEVVIELYELLLECLEKIFMDVETVVNIEKELSEKLVHLSNRFETQDDSVVLPAEVLILVENDGGEYRRCEKFVYTALG